MKLRKKIIIYFSTSIISLIGISFVIIYFIFSDYRQEEFHQRLKDRTETTFKFLIEIEQNDRALLKAMDKHTINKLYEEKVLIFDKKKELIYSSVDDTRIDFPLFILEKLSKKKQELETEQDGYEVAGIYLEKNNIPYYGIAKAYDKYGQDKIVFLKWLLLGGFVFCTVIVLLVSLYLSWQISAPLNLIAKEINEVKIENLQESITVPKSGDEIEQLAKRFNEMLSRIIQSIKFQSHFIHHVSHEMKTPIAVLISNIERVENLKDQKIILKALHQQKAGLRDLADIIDSLLEISKRETIQPAGNTEKIRIDELIFEVLDELRFINDKAEFELVMNENLEDDKQLVIKGNKRLLKSAFLNLAKNALNYSKKQKPVVEISAAKNGINLFFCNDGKVISEEERPYLFEHFFRGENSQEIKGFGLGLVLTNRIVQLHGGSINYNIADNGWNRFVIFLPLQL